MELLTKQEAKQQGLKFYFTGKLCKNGHTSKRYVSGNHCVECSQLNSKHYFVDNKDTILKRSENWRLNNPEKAKQSVKNWHQENAQHIIDYRCNNTEIIRQYKKEYYKSNLFRLRKLGKNWRKANPEKCFEYTKLRNTRLEQSIPSWYEEVLIKQLYLKRDELNKKWGTNLQVDHIIPLNPKCGTVSGLHCWANLQLLDASLNQMKGSKYKTDW